MKKSELLFSAVQVPVDFVMIVFAALTAFSVRNIPSIIALQPKLYSFPLHQYNKVVFATVPFFLVVYAFEGLYDNRVTRKFWKEVLRVFGATSIGLMIVIVAIFLKREWFSSRFIILAAWILAVIYVSFARYLLQLTQKWFLRNLGIGVHRVLLIGKNEKMNIFSKMIEENKNLGYRVVEQIDTASLKTVKKIKKELGIDEIILCESSITDDEQEKLIDYCMINNVVYKYIPTGIQTAKFEISMFNNEPLIELKSTPLDGWGRISKRIFDLFFSIIGIIIASPVLLATAIAVKLDSDGPIIYKNERIGADGEKFKVYKFRYMKWDYCITKENLKNNDALKYEKELIERQSIRQGPLYKIKNDPRKTRVGKIIEKYSIDELPQLFNVLFGSMSLVGPRPHQEREIEKYMEYHRRLLTIKPGVSGMAQISGRSDLDFEDEYKLDLYYIENWSLLLDISICLKTVGVLFRKRRNW